MLNRDLADVGLAGRAGRQGRGDQPVERGQSLVEFALILPIILMVLLGAVDLGRAAYAQTALANAARAGARVGIVDQNVTDACNASPDIARCVASRQAIALNIGPDAVAVSFQKTDLSTPCSTVVIGCLAEVTVTYAFAPITPIIQAITGTLPMSATARLPVERVYTTP